MDEVSRRDGGGPWRTRLFVCVVCCYWQGAQRRPTLCRYRTDHSRWGRRVKGSWGRCSVVAVREGQKQFTEVDESRKRGRHKVLYKLEQLLMRRGRSALLQKHPSSSVSGVGRYVYNFSPASDHQQRAASSERLSGARVVPVGAAIPAGDLHRITPPSAPTARPPPAPAC